MIQHLYIKNYALINELNIDFKQGFSVMTGETGSGKSIILGALGLILGNRADHDAVLNKDEKCIVEGTFNLRSLKLQTVFSQFDLDYDDITHIRREIKKDGKSRAFINDTPVNLAVLKEISERLINIHSQNEIITLNHSNFQLSVVDSYAQITQAVNEYRKAFFEHKKKTATLQELIKVKRDQETEQDYLTFLVSELENINISEEEYNKLGNELNLLENAEEIKQHLYTAQQMLSDQDPNALDLILNSLHELKKTSEYDGSLQELHPRLQSVYLELKDLAATLASLQEEIVISNERVHEITEILDHIQKLEQKHHVSGIAALKSIENEINEKINSYTSLETSIAALEKDLKQGLSVLTEMAKNISQKRANTYQAIEASICMKLQQLGMPGAVFLISHSSSSNLHQDGFDQIKFLFSANTGHEPSDLATIASGGELSRIMLSIKSLISENRLLPTILFDEIDAGVSGEIAGKVGDILYELGQKMQVLAITHLPQIAARGDHHYKVKKVQDQNKASTRIELIEGEERIHEIAQMIEGNDFSQHALLTARHLVEK